MMQKALHNFGNGLQYSHIFVPMQGLRKAIDLQFFLPETVFLTTEKTEVQQRKQRNKYLISNPLFPLLIL